MAKPLSYKPEPAFALIDEALKTVRNELPVLVKLNNELSLRMPAAQEEIGGLDAKISSLKELEADLKQKTDTLAVSIVKKRADWDVFAATKLDELTKLRKAAENELDAKRIDLRTVEQGVAEATLRLSADQQAVRDRQSALDEAEAVAEGRMTLAEAREAELAVQAAELDDKLKAVEEQHQAASATNREHERALAKLQTARTALDDREHAISGREDDLTCREAKLAAQEASMQAREQLVAHRSGEFVKRDAELTKRQLRLEDREQTLQSNLSNFGTR